MYMSRSQEMSELEKLKQALQGKIRQRTAKRARKLLIESIENKSTRADCTINKADAVPSAAFCVVPEVDAVSIAAAHTTVTEVDSVPSAAFHTVAKADAVPIAVAHPVPNAHVIDLTGSDESPKSRWSKYTLQTKKRRLINKPRLMDSDKSLLRLIGYKSSGTSRRGSGPGVKLTIELNGNHIDRGKLNVTYKQYSDGSSEEEFTLS